MYHYINRRAKHVVDDCSMLSGIQFQLSWNAVPTYLEQESNLAVTKRELKKLTARAYWVRHERWRLEVGRVSNAGDWLWNEPPRSCQASIKRYVNSG